MGNCETCVGEHPSTDMQIHQPINRASKLHHQTTLRPNSTLVATQYPDPHSIISNKNLYPSKKQTIVSQSQIGNLFKSISYEDSQAYKKYGRNINHEQNGMKNSQAILGNSRSRLLSQSVVYSNIYRAASTQDNNLKSEKVKSRLKNMPMLSASQRKDIYEPDVQIYLEEVKGKYVGSISEMGLPDGYGKIYFDNKDFLQGTFVNGRCEGNGRMIKSDGSYFQGDLKNNVADGYGRFIGKDGFKYQGQWKNNMANGSGEAIYSDGSRYLGEFFNNTRHGKGTLYQGDLIFRGDFRNGKLNGNGYFSSQNGQSYEGAWKEGKKHGHGKYSWPDDSSYEGEYSEDKRHGMGKMLYSNGQFYHGEWKYGQKDGKGQFRSAKQNFVGYWKNGNLVKVEE